MTRLELFNEYHESRSKGWALMIWLSMLEICNRKNLIEESDEWFKEMRSWYSK